jgi:hypothetical protein
LTLEQLIDLDHAEAKLPKKGSIGYDVAKSWKVHSNAHGWAQAKDYLTAVVFVRQRLLGPQYQLLVVGRCPWRSGRVRFYTAPLTAAVWS